MNTRWMIRLLWLAALWNIAGGASALLDPAGHLAQMYHGTLALDQPLAAFFYQCTWINVIAWGLAYGFASFSAGARPVVMAAGSLGKTVYFMACFNLYLSGAGKPVLLAAGLFDLGLALLFGWAALTLRRTAIAKI